MATTTQTLITDDLTGEEGASTVLFGLDGVNYEIDLTPENEASFREVLEGMAKVARKIGGKKKASAPKRTSDAGKIRAWASENGHQVGSRGRIPSEVIEAYAAAHKG